MPEGTATETVLGLIYSNVSKVKQKKIHFLTVAANHSKQGKI